LTEDSGEEKTMALEELRQQARSWLLELANCVWSEDQADDLAQQAKDLKQHIRRGYEELFRRRRAIESQHRRIAEQEQQAAALPWQVEAFLQVRNRQGAWRAALELDRVRGNLDSDRARLQALEAGYRQQVVRLEKDRQLLGQLQLHLMRLAGAARTAQAVG
jgi:hypothetical protein